MIRFKSHLIKILICLYITRLCYFMHIMLIVYKYHILNYKEKKENFYFWESNMINQSFFSYIFGNIFSLQNLRVLLLFEIYVFYFFLKFTCSTFFENYIITNWNGRIFLTSHWTWSRRSSWRYFFFNFNKKEITSLSIFHI